MRKRKYLGWFCFVAGCVALLTSLILLNFLMNWTPSWFIAVSLVGLGAWLLRLRVRAVFGIVCGLLAVSNLVYCVAASSKEGIWGIPVFGFLSWILLRKGLFEKSKIE